MPATPTEDGPCFVGVDVGTGSTRAAIINAHGDILGLHVQPIQTWHPRHDIYQQSSADIWSSVCVAVRSALTASNLPATRVRGIGFDATCSLVVLDAGHAPVSVDKDSAFAENDQDVILWADHRAAEQADRINATQHTVLSYVGGAVSLEMEVPKILWLKENAPREHWDRVAHLFDLPDFLTFRATGSLARSACSLTCKCSFVPPGVEGSKGWDDSFFDTIGLSEFVQERYRRIGGVPGENGEVLFAGDVVGNGLAKNAAEEMGLVEGTPVGSAVIDAYAGAIATLGAGGREEAQEGSVVQRGANRLAIICGTSSCHIAMSPRPIFVPGVWGPYLSVLVPSMWCAEGGQSSTGQLIDHTLTTHPSISEARSQAASQNLDIYTFLNTRLAHLRTVRHLPHLELLTTHLHIYPDFHGNRSPLADPTLRGTVSGLSLDTSVDDLALRYYATLQAIACQTRHILESLNKQGYTLDTLCLSGGLCRNPLFLSLHADVTRCRVVLPRSIEGAVVVGAAFLGAKAATAAEGKREELWDVMVRMGQAGEVVEPTRVSEVVELNERRYRVFRKMLEDQRKYRAIMEGRA
ncbi:hypothetical protein BC938DRAFT_479430 [Jimgerdemannia flammicorona]|uniref:Uncharacterized protein n=1 Tax=Jimgerdemannia flammicorona TaxID=994334 RepID=A0A433QXW4_9FUNG|nr:hypothetical protein BC938DRAFT_479430 [Jimgerdemannia flammicorona]